MASYSSEEEDYSGSEEELSEEVRPCMLHGPSAAIPHTLLALARPAHSYVSSAVSDKI